MNEQAFLRAICAAPDDDGPRLVYADWLDEQGDADRAEFIRLQCALAADATDSPRRREVAFRARELRDRNAVRWSEGLPSWEWERTFRRGFVERVGLNPEMLKKGADTLFTTTPLRELWVTDLWEEV